MMPEEWRPVPSCPGYEVSDTGRICSLPRVLAVSGSAPTKRAHQAHTRMNCGKLLTLRQTKQGYLYARVAGGRTLFVSRAVCHAFNGPPPSADHEADHNDCVRTNNVPTNLTWLSKEDNRARRNHAAGERVGGSKLTAAQVQTIYMNASRAALDAAIAARFGVSRETVRNIRLGRQWKHVTERIRIKDIGEAA